MYAGRGMLKAVVLERGIPGGELLNTEKVEDYPGFLSILGRDLAAKMTEHAEAFGADIRMENVESVRREADGTFRVETSLGTVFRAPTVILTAGGTPIKLGIPGELEYAGPRRLVLRGLRRRLLQERNDRGGGRRRRRGRGSGLPHPVRHQGVHHPPSRCVPRLEAAPGAALRQSQDRSHLEHHRHRDQGRCGGHEGTGAAEYRRPDPMSTLAATGVFIFVGFTPNSGLIKEHFNHDASWLHHHRRPDDDLDSRALRRGRPPGAAHPAGDDCSWRRDHRGHRGGEVPRRAAQRGARPVSDLEIVPIPNGQFAENCYLLAAGSERGPDRSRRGMGALPRRCRATRRDAGGDLAHPRASRSHPRRRRSPAGDRRADLAASRRSPAL